MDLRISGRRALVTGSSSGIGYAIARGAGARRRRRDSEWPQQEKIGCRRAQVAKGRRWSGVRGCGGGRVDRRRRPAQIGTLVGRHTIAIGNR